ncbi:luciferin 4-monooxygenase-like [Xylocopa sonorina]|uniref:luciferin 4-monooxygenase-like n=1 Tax=Xylocopa sonorina TaxID=1818115 RepID=UPI00403A7C8F
MANNQDNVIVGKELVFPESSLNVGEVILEIFRSKPDVVGQIEANTGETRTYKEMMEKSIKCAIWLRKKGIKPGDTVAICSGCFFDVYAPVFACFYIGAVCAVEYQQLPLQLNVNIETVTFETGFNEILSMRTPSTEIERFRCENVENPKEVALLIPTSGSTGLPKSAELSHLALRTLIHPAYTRETTNRVDLCAAAVRWITYFIDAMSALRGNATRIIADDGKDAKYYCDLIKKYKVETYTADSNIIRQIYKFGLIDDLKRTNLKIIRFGGSPFARQVHKELIKQLPGVNVLQMYGSTDVGNCITRQVRGCKYGSCGYVCQGVRIKVVCMRTGNALGPNEQGEICVKTTSQMNGYRDNHEATMKAIDTDGWVHMGDIGYYDEDGEFYIVGRTSEFIKYKDCCLSVPEIEAVLDAHPAVCKSAVISIPSDIEGELPIALVIKLPNKQVTERELISYFTKNAPEFYALARVKFIDDLPYTATKKIAKTELKRMFIDGLI